VYQVLRFILVLVVTLWAMALVVIDEILATARKASTLRAIRNVLAYPGTVIFYLFLETVVAVAVVVVLVFASGLLMVFTRTMRTTHVRLAIVHVDTTGMRRDNTISLAMCRQRYHAFELTIDSETLIALELGDVFKHKR
jgi:hypothetical protein